MISEESSDNPSHNISEQLQLYPIDSSAYEPTQAILLEDDKITINALSLKQPYANLIANGKKTIETRTWATKYRGDLLICASQSGAGEPKGVALCIVDLYGIRPMVEADESCACVEIYNRANAWLIRDLRILKRPFKVKGHLGIYKLETTKEQLLTLKD